MKKMMYICRQLMFPKAAKIYEFGPFRLNASEMLLMKNGVPVPLRPKVFETLLILIQNNRRLVTKEDLLNEVWHDCNVEEANLAQIIYLLRKILCEKEGGARYIETVSRYGYRFVADIREIGIVETANEMSQNPDDAKKHEDTFINRAKGDKQSEIKQQYVEKDDSFNAHSSSPRIKYHYFYAFVLILCAVVLLLVLALYRSKEQENVKLQIRSIAVLPFKSLNSGQDEVISSDITKSIELNLRYHKGFSVIAASSLTIEANDDPIKAGAKLRADAVLTGTVLKTQRQIRVTAQLIGVEQDNIIWSKHLDEETSDKLDIPALENMIGYQIAGTLGLKIKKDNNFKIDKNYADNTKAHQAYVLGVYLWKKRTPESIYKSIEHFQQAASLDTEYALAYSGMSDSYSLIASNKFGPMPQDEAWKKAVKAATRALELNDQMAGPTTVLAMYKTIYEKDYKAAQELHLRALALNPNYSDGHLRYGSFLIQCGKLEQGLKELQKAQELDPTAVANNVVLAQALILARRYDEAIVYGTRANDVAPDNLYSLAVISEAYAYRGMYDEALKVFTTEQSNKHSDTFLLEEMAYLYALTGKVKEAKSNLARLQNLARVKEVDNYKVASAYAVLGQADKAFLWLRQAKEIKNEFLLFYPGLDSIRNDPRYNELLKHTATNIKVEY